MKLRWNMIGRFLKFTFGFITGGLVGGMAASLLTPKSGDSIRKDIKNSIDEIRLDYETGRQKKREDLEAEIKRRWEG